MSKVNALISMLAVAAVAFFIGYVVGPAPPEDETAISPEQAAKLPTVAKGIEMCPRMGPVHPKVTILEFSEFQ